MAKKIYTLTEEEIEKFCNTETTNFEGESLGIIGRYVRSRGSIDKISKIEIYVHDETTKNYMLNAAVGTAFFALAYDEDGEAYWYQPVEAISNTNYIPVLDEHGSWSWNLISNYVLQHILG